MDDVIIEFGSYPRSLVQDEETLSLLKEAQEEEASIGEARYIRYEGKWYRFEPLRFVVLQKDEGRIDLLSFECVDGVKYGDGINPIYSRSFILKWLESDFVKAAFTKEEQQRIPAIGLPDSFDLHRLPEECKPAPITEFALAHTSSDTYWTSETRSGWTGSFQDYEDRPDEVAVVEATGPYPGDINIHKTGLLDYRHPVRVYLSIKSDEQ